MFDLQMDPIGQPSDTDTVDSISVLTALRQCVDKGRYSAGEHPEASFHSTTVQAAGSRVIADTIACNNHMPFASSSRSLPSSP